ncbi:MAG: hypothetical protein DRP34_01565 [Thermodesulfobacteriota bacterium]|nr:MAG: hypothetical protein DRP34_01565 [Thermodesulfobacteriota bacterium]
MKVRKEKQLYEVIKERLEEILKAKFNDFYLEITADTGFSNKLKSEIPRGREIIFNFLKKARPDITGFVKENSFSYFIVVEIKNSSIELDDIYQTKKYAQLFGAKYALLISTNEIPEEIKRLDKTINPDFLSGAYGYRIVLVHLDINKKEFVEWYEKKPF